MSQPTPSEDETDQPQVTDLARVDTDSVLAEMVRMHQSSAQKVEAADIELNQSAAAQVKAEKLSAHNTALGMVQSDKITSQNSAIGAVKADEAYLNGVVGVVAADTVEFGNTYAGIIAGREVRGERIESIILLARHVDGNVKTVVDTRGAVIAGLLGGLFAGLVLLVGRMVFRRN
jgi:hypothetical protein